MLLQKLLLLLAETGTEEAMPDPDLPPPPPPCLPAHLGLRRTSRTRHFLAFSGPDLREEKAKDTCALRK